MSGVSRQPVYMLGVGGQSEPKTDHQGYGACYGIKKYRQRRPPIQCLTQGHYVTHKFLGTIRHTRQRSTSCWTPFMLRTTTSSSNNSNRCNKMDRKQSVVNDTQSADTPSVRVFLIAAPVGVASYLVHGFVPLVLITDTVAAIDSGCAMPCCSPRSQLVVTLPAANVGCFMTNFSVKIFDQ